MTLSERDLRNVWHPYTQAQIESAPVPIVRGEGSWLFDENGEKYLDAISSWWVNIHGHAHPYIADKISEQARVLEQVIFAGFTHKPAIELAERILNVLPGNFSKVFYSDDGSTAVEVALKMALQLWYNRGEKKKAKVIAFKNAYHGDTFGAMSVSERGVFTEPFSPLLFEVNRIAVPLKGFESQSLVNLKSAIENNKSEIAAFVFEPLVMGAGGMLMYEPEPLDELIVLCKANKIITIADEVMTGFGRTGKLFACENLKSAPDIICLSKGITGGFMPLGLTACTEEIFKAFYSSDRTKTFFHGHSYTANPLACAAALASLDLCGKEDFKNELSRINSKHQTFKSKITGHQRVENVRVKGTILAFDLKTDESTSYLNKERNRIYDFFIGRGILLRPLGNTIYIMPPYCITNEELDMIYQSITDFLS